MAFHLSLIVEHARIKRGQMGLDRLKNHNAIELLSNTGPDPLKNHKATKPAFKIGPHRRDSETPLKWYLDPFSPHQRNKNVVRVGPPLTNFLDPCMW